MTEPAPHTTPETDLIAPELANLVRERDEWKDKAYRYAAEIENLRRRTQQDVTDAKQYAATGFARDMLGIADTFLRALQSPEGNEAALREGLALTASQLEQTFSRNGINRIVVTAGQHLNPDHHQVMMETPSTYPVGSIVAELQPGFTIHGRLLRPTLVSVAARQTTQQESSHAE